MDNQKEMVLVEKAVIEKLFEMLEGMQAQLEDMQEQLDSIDNDLYTTKQTAFDIAGKLGVL